NIPVETVREIQKYCPVYPDDRLLEVAQNRINEKQFLNDIGIPTARWAAANDPDDVEMIANEIDCSEFILKTARFGYDGKGQVSCSIDDDTRAKWKSLNSKEIILEEKVDFTCEISVIIARDKLGQSALY